MKRLILFFLLFIPGILCSQTNDQATALKILKKVFPKYQINSIYSQKTFVTEVWDNHANIPIDNCMIVELSNGICALAFEIYMSKTPEDYTDMLKEKITKESEINETSLYKGTGERLIQIIFFDLINNTFIGKPEGFPLPELLWYEQDFMSPSRTDKIKTFEAIESCTNTILLSIEEFEQTKPYMNYIFKLHDGKIMTKSLKTCIESFQEKNNKLWLHHIENCEEVENEDAIPEHTFRLIFKW